MSVGRIAPRKPTPSRTEDSMDIFGGEAIERSSD
jgi:hypothetical protein